MINFYSKSCHAPLVTALIDCMTVLLGYIGVYHNVDQWHQEFITAGNAHTYGIECFVELKPCRVSAYLVNSYK